MSLLSQKPVLTELQYLRHFPVGWVERSETQRIHVREAETQRTCWVSSLNPTYESNIN